MILEELELITNIIEDLIDDFGIIIPIETKEEAKKNKENLQKELNKSVEIGTTKNSKGEYKTKKKQFPNSYKDVGVLGKPKLEDIENERAIRRSIGRHTKKIKGSVSESCLEDILKLVEGEVISFQAKRKEKVLDRNAHKMADILRNGNVRITKTGTLIGNPESLKKVKEIEKENQEVGLGKKVV